MKGFTPLLVWIVIPMKFLQSCSIVRDSPNLSVNIAVFLTAWVRLFFFFLLLDLLKILFYTLKIH
ncbi:hypothetical protein HPSH112_02610 [Helicobacter pylori Shi112]|nr:hypothetical protein HPSH112_02610 [Helicobacter pylori Shi112]